MKNFASGVRQGAVSRKQLKYCALSLSFLSIPAMSTPSYLSEYNFSSSSAEVNATRATRHSTTNVYLDIFSLLCLYRWLARRSLYTLRTGDVTYSLSFVCMWYSRKARSSPWMALAEGRGGHGTCISSNTQKIVQLRNFTVRVGFYCCFCCAKSYGIFFFQVRS